MKRLNELLAERALSIANEVLRRPRVLRVMSEIVVRFPKPIAVFFAIAGVPFFVLATFASTWMTFSLHTIAHGFPHWKIAIGYVIFPYMTVFSAKSAWTLIRYGTETLFTTFRLSSGGITIENRRYGMLTLAWHDVDAACYNRSLKMLVLKSHRLAKPIAIMNNAARESAEFRAAVSKIRKGVQNRFSARWV